jgi:NADH-quinone oxidoreductase subunit M
MGCIGLHALSLVIVVPLGTALALMLVPKENKLAVRLLSAIAASVTLVVSLWAFVAYDRARAGMQFEEKIEWLPAIGVSYHVGADGVSLTLVLLTALIIFGGVFASWTIEHRTKEFYILLLTLVTGVFGVFVSLDLFFFFLFYELAVLPMYLLIGIWGTGPKEYSALKLTLYLLVGSAFMLLALVGLYFLSGLEHRTFDIVEITKQGRFPVPLQHILFLLCYVGFGVLAGVWPLHTWSPDGHASAPTAASMLHAGVLMKLGAYGIYRIGIGILPEGAATWAPLVAGIAVVNILYGSFVAMGQKDFKYVIAYSSVSHMGIVMLGLAAGIPGRGNAIAMSGSVFQMFSHGIMTGLFFAIVGLVYEKSHTRDITRMGGFAQRMAGIALIFAIGGMTSFGLPGTSGFVAELLVFLGTWRVYPLLAALAVIGIVTTAIYVLRVIQKIFLGPLDARYSELPEARTTEWVAIVLLAGVLLLFGLWPRPMVSLIETALPMR